MRCTCKTVVFICGYKHYQIQLQYIDLCVIVIGVLYVTSHYVYTL